MASDTIKVDIVNSELGTKLMREAYVRGRRDERESVCKHLAWVVERGYGHDAAYIATCIEGGDHIKVPKARNTERLPAHLEIDLDGTVTKTDDSPLAGVIGQWPGDETDAELFEALDELKGKR
jgi:hypothetical protein